MLQNALFKGAKGRLGGAYGEEVGARRELVVGMIEEYERRKMRVRVYRANQPVGLQVRGSLYSRVKVVQVLMTFQ